jgi:hypothetical protein
MSTISLDEAQRNIAIDLLEQVESDEVTVPTDFLDEWGTPDDSIDDSAKGDREFPQHKEFVSPTKIKGALGSSSRLEPVRLQQVLKWMVEENFEDQRPYPPHLQKWGERYYVCSDGHHRCMAAKAVGLEELYVEYEEVPIELLE